MVAGATMTLGDGRDYTLAPLTLGALEELQDRIAAVGGEDQRAAIATMIDVAHRSLRRNYPDMTRETVGDLLDLGNMGEVFSVVMGASGASKADAPGEAAAGQGGRTGRRSTRR